MLVVTDGRAGLATKSDFSNTTEVWDDAGMRLDEISKNDADILRKIIALAQQLSLPLTSFTQALGQIREQEFGIPGRSRHRQAKAELRR